MSIIVLSVPYTGTRFTCSFLDYLRVVYAQHHTEISSLNDLYFHSRDFRTGVQNKAIIPVRDPLLCFASTYIRSGSNPETQSARKALDDVVLSYDLLMQMEDWFDFKHLRLDCDDKKAELEGIAEFVGKDFDGGFHWEPVGNINDKATDYNIVNAITKDWEPDLMAMILRRLQGARDHYGYS